MLPEDGFRILLNGCAMGVFLYVLNIQVTWATYI